MGIGRDDLIKSFSHCAGLANLYDVKRGMTSGCRITDETDARIALIETAHGHLHQALLNTVERHYGVKNQIMLAVDGDDLGPGDVPVLLLAKDQKMSFRQARAMQGRIATFFNDLNSFAAINDVPDQIATLPATNVLPDRLPLGIIRYQFDALHKILHWRTTELYPGEERVAPPELKVLPYLNSAAHIAERLVRFKPAQELN